jgi:hypothetical protein
MPLYQDSTADIRNAGVPRIRTRHHHRRRQATLEGTQYRPGASKRSEHHALE